MSLDTTPASLNRDQAAAYLGLRPSTLALYAAEDRGPPFVKLSPARSGRVRYLRDQLDAWLRAGAPTNRRGARPPQCPPGTFSRPDVVVGRDGRGKFSRRHPGQ